MPTEVDVITEIIDICTQHPRHEAYKLLVALFDEQMRAATIAAQIKVTSRPGIASDIGFREIGRGTRPSDGKAYKLFDISTMLGKHELDAPHEAGRKLSNEEITEVVIKWNEETKRLLKPDG